MIFRIKELAKKILTALVSTVKKLLILSTLLSFVVLFILFFRYMYIGDPIMCLVCLAGIYTFIHLNEVL